MEILGFLVRIGVMLLDPVSWIFAFVLVAVLRRFLPLLAIVAIAAVVGGLALEALVTSMNAGLGRRFGANLVYFIILQALQAGLIAWIWQRMRPAARRLDC